VGGVPAWATVSVAKTGPDPKVVNTRELDLGIVVVFGWAVRLNSTVPFPDCWDNVTHCGCSVSIQEAFEVSVIFIVSPDTDASHDNGDTDNDTGAPACDTFQI